MANPPRHAKAPAVLGNRRNRYYANWLSFGVSGGARPSIDEWMGFGGPVPLIASATTQPFENADPIFITGTGFGTLGGTVWLTDSAVDHTGGVQQPVTFAWDDTNIECECDTTGLSTGTYYLWVNNGINWSVAGFAVSIVVGGAVEGSARGVVAITGRTNGSKIAAGTARGATAPTARPTGRKIATGATRGTAAPVGRTQGSKVAGGAARAAVTITARATGTASTIIQGASRALVAITSRTTGTKTATGATRAPVVPTGRTSASKVATGATRAAVTVTGRATGTGSAIIAGTVRAVVAITSRATGSKVTTGTTRGPVVALGRPTGAKVALGAARAPVTTTGRTTGAKTALGTTRGPVALIARQAGTKTAQGFTRAVHALIGLVAGDAGAPIPPLPIPHTASAHLRHDAIANLASYTSAVTVHSVSRSGVRHQATTTDRHRAQARETSC